LRKW
jgi:hypothetical protein